MDLTKLWSTINALSGLIPYVSQVAAIAPAVTTTISFVEDTINNWRTTGVMTEQQWLDAKNRIANLKKDPAWQTDAERGVK